MNQKLFAFAVVFTSLSFSSLTPQLRSEPVELRTGMAGHAFDHNGTMADQGETAAASGATIIYATGLGGLGYEGLPKPEVMLEKKRATKTYIQTAKKSGIHLAIGYVCATSMVNLDSFDKNWTPEFRARFQTSPADWRQQDRQGKALPSWYGGQYQPACMNNPDWREYERFMVRSQLEAGCDGIFFDNPTVHAQGCYCPACMKQFARFLSEEVKPAIATAPTFDGTNSIPGLREWANKHPADFMKFRCTTARDFIAEMRTYARSVKSGALITVNNSLNSPDVFFSQCRSVAYNIYEMSKTEDFVVLEDMATQPRSLADGRVFEYTPTYRMVHAISHGKPVVAVTVADADYTTAPDLMRLAAAEAAANDASYLSWPTWPEAQRGRMAGSFRPEMDLLRTNANLLQGTQARSDVLLFLPFRQWLVTEQCRAGQLAAELTRANVAFDVICEDDLRTARAGTLPKRLRGEKLLLVEATNVFTLEEIATLEKFKQAGGLILTAEKADWLSALQTAVHEPAVKVKGPATIRAVVRDQRGKTIVHLLNLNVQKVNSFEDKVFSASDVSLTVRVPLKKVHSVRALTADATATAGVLKFSVSREGKESVVEFTVPQVSISTIAVIE